MITKKYSIIFENIKKLCCTFLYFILIFNRITDIFIFDNLSAKQNQEYLK